jgi:hypothetical protein
MGACGCGDFGGGLSFPGPKGSTYVLEFQQHCADCEAPMGMRILKVPATNDWGEPHEYLDDNQPLKFIEVDDHREAAIPLADPSAILKAVVAALGDPKVHLDRDEFPLSEWIENDPDEVELAVVDTIWQTIHGGER